MQPQTWRSGYPDRRRPGYYDTVISMCAEAGFSPRIKHEVSNWLTALVLVSRGAGVALIPDAFIQAKLAGVRYVPLEGNKVRSLALCSWKRADQDPVLRKFLHCLRDSIDTP